MCILHIFSGPLPAQIKPLPKAHDHLPKLHMEMRREWWEERQARVRKQLMEERAGLGVMEATKTAREFVAQVKTYSLTTNKKDLKQLELAIEEALPKGEVGKEELRDTVEELRTSWGEDGEGGWESQPYARQEHSPIPARPDGL